MSINRNILFISSWYPTSNDPTLGIFVRRHAEAAGLLNNVIVLHAIGINGLKEPEFKYTEFDHHKELIIHYPKVGIKVPGLKQLLSLNKLFKFYNKGLTYLNQKGFQPDLIHVNIMAPIGLIAKTWKRRFKLPYIITEHWTGYLNSDGRYEKDSKLKKIVPPIANQANWILPVSNDLKKSLIERGFKTPSKTIRNVVNTNKFNCSPSENKQFLVIADLENKQKNISGIIDGFYQFHKNNPNVILTIAGGGEDEIKIKNKISQLGLNSHIQLIGRVDAEKLNYELNQSYGLILFSNYENLPCVIIESFATGTPVISTDVGGISEILNEDRGILIQPKDISSLKEAMEKCIKKNWNTQSIRSYAVDNFSMEKIGEEFTKVYQEVI